MDIGDGTTTSWCPSIGSQKRKVEETKGGPLCADAVRKGRSEKTITRDIHRQHFRVLHSLANCHFFLPHKKHTGKEPKKINDLSYIQEQRTRWLLNWRGQGRNGGGRWGEKTAGSAGRCATLLLEQTKMGTANVCLTEMSPNVFFCVGYGGCGSVCSRMQKPNLMIVTVREQLKFHFPFCANVFKVLVSTWKNFRPLVIFPVNLPRPPDFATFAFLATK